MLNAAPVGREQARQEAMRFLQARHGEQAARGMRLVGTTKTNTEEARDYYVFNVGQEQGFVLVSGDDRTDPVLGYSDEGSFCEEQMPENLRAWLEGYGRQMKMLGTVGDQTEARSRVRKASLLRTSISPLLKTRWDQYAPYNDQCPYVNGTDGERTVTGCVATALAQLMYYYQQPAQTKAAIPGYTTEKLKLTMPTIASGTTLQWGEMLETYTGSYTNEQAAAVATLMRLVGTAVQMNYNSYTQGGSSASSDGAPSVLSTYFGYDVDAKMAYRNDYTYSGWLDLVYGELAKGNPVFYNGQSIAGGHAFICDGYDEEDFFHINWGWGGQSDGYYRLSILKADAAGIGGSSYAYSFDQSVMVKVNPTDDGNNETNLNCLETVSIGVHEAPTTFNRASSGDNFYGIGIDISIRTPLASETEYDHGFALIKDGEMVGGAPFFVFDGAKEVEPQYIYTMRIQDYTLRAGLDDGVYRIVGVSRINGQSDWHVNGNSDTHYITATIEGNTLTLETMSTTTQANLSATLALSGTGTARVGSPATIVATVTNNSKTIYTGTLQLVRKSGGNSYRADGTQTDIAGNGTKEVTFTITPQAIGTMNLELWNKLNIKIGELTINVEAGDGATTGSLEIGTTTIKNGSLATEPGEVYGSYADATVSITNTSATPHTSGLRVWLFKWALNKETGMWSGSGVSYKDVDLSLPAGGTGSVSFRLDNLLPDIRYSFYYYTTDGTGIASSPFFYSKPAITFYAADGTTSVLKREGTTSLAVPAEAVAADLSGTSLATLTPNGNPNTLYFFGADDAVPDVLNGKNVVKGSEAKTLTLSDGHDFYTPVAFTAEKASYTRQFSVGADGTHGWSTIVVPFDVDEVRSGSKVIDWFHSSSDTGKNFWLKEFSSENEGAVCFDFADKLKAYTPYIIAVPGNKWGESWNLTNRDITFSGSNVSIAADAKANVNGNVFKFVGTTCATDVADAYMLNGDGTAFEKTTGKQDAFRASFRAVSYVSSTVLPIVQEGSQATGLQHVGIGSAADDGTVYSLQGMKVNGQMRQLPKGIYVKNGKKIIR